uniref:Transmembrane protein 61 n=1 Tax=Eptatretus burgeri TaxID=7764 RepID=A0A8C4N5Y7_EPTBU
MASEGCLGVRYCLVVLGIGMLSLGILMVTWQSFVEEPTTSGNESSGNLPSTSIAPPLTFDQPDFTTYAFCIAGSLLLAVGIIWSIYQNLNRSPGAEDAHPTQSSEKLVLHRQGVRSQSGRAGFTCCGALGPSSTRDPLGAAAIFTSYMLIKVFIYKCTNLGWAKEKKPQFMCKNMYFRNYKKHHYGMKTTEQRK